MDQNNFKKTVFKAALFTLLGYGFSQGLRFGSNVVLTRLLVPEFFGIIAIANVFHRGIGLFSDIGLDPGIIRSDRSNDPGFINTAWTIQVLRGAILFFFSLFIAYPVARFYDEMMLLYIVPAISFVSILQGFKSTSLVLLIKELRQDKIMGIEIGVQLVSSAIMIAIAFYTRNIWALIAGAVIAAFLMTVCSHFINRKGIRNHFHYEKDAARELVSFGKWILVSTAMMFLATQADRLMLGRIFPLALFGVYNIAAMLAEFPKSIIETLSQKVIYPLITKFAHLPRKELNGMIMVQRRKILLPLAVFVALLCCFGDYLVIFLYDERYINAAWILPLLAIGIWPLVLTATVDRTLYAIGKPKFAALGNFVKFIYMIVFLPLMSMLWGTLGAVLCVVFNDLPIYGVVFIGLKRNNLSFIQQDILFTFLLLLLVTFLIFVRFSFNLSLPGYEAYSEFLLSKSVLSG